MHWFLRVRVVGVSISVSAFVSSGILFSGGRVSGSIVVFGIRSDVVEVSK